MDEDYIDDFIREDSIEVDDKKHIELINKEEVKQIIKNIFDNKIQKYHYLSKVEMFKEDEIRDIRIANSLEVILKEILEEIERN